MNKTNEQDANRISDGIVLTANTELQNGTFSTAVLVGVCLGLLGVLSGRETQFQELVTVLKNTIASLTGINKDKIKFYDSPGGMTQ